VEEALMAKNARYCAPYRRRREGRTNYRARRSLVLSRVPRLVARSSLKNIVAEIVVAKPEGDHVLVSAHSKELAKKFGWRASRKNLSAAYLTGLLCGLRAKGANIKQTNLDIGLHTPSKGASIFSVLKGVLDAGVNVAHSEEKLPDKKRIEGEHIADYAKNLSTAPEEYQARFSKYLSQKLTPEDFPKHFAEVKANVLAAYPAASGGKKA
jgi:large subunit ribosomal protein L18